LHGQVLMPGFKARASNMETEIGAWSEAAPAEARKAPSRPVDLVHLSRYTLGERTLEREVLGLFCTQSVVYLARLRESPSAKDWKEAAHSLKGSAQAIGAWRAAAAAERAEALPAEAFNAARHARYLEVESTLGEAKAYISSLLEDR
jgi:HPt (histidine-containing phosphotransfer) domain-containing protein